MRYGTLYIIQHLVKLKQFLPSYESMFMYCTEVTILS